MLGGRLHRAYRTARVRKRCHAAALPRAPRDQREGARWAARGGRLLDQAGADAGMGAGSEPATEAATGEDRVSLEHKPDHCVFGCPVHAERRRRDASGVVDLSPLPRADRPGTSALGAVDHAKLRRLLGCTPDEDAAAAAARVLVERDAWMRLAKAWEAAALGLGAWSAVDAARAQLRALGIDP